MATYLYREVSTFIISLARAMLIPSYIERYTCIHIQETTRPGNVDVPI